MVLINRVIDGVLYVESFFNLAKFPVTVLVAVLGFVTSPE